MKKIIGGLLGFITASAFLLACGSENADGSCPFKWILSLLLIALVCGCIWNEFFAPTHILTGTYEDLNRQIEDWARSQEDGYHEHTFESDNAQVKVGVRNKTTQSKFRDDAWGHPKTFTETNWYSTIEVLDVTVYDKDDNPTDNHDFDEGYIETEYESGGSWE